MHPVIEHILARQGKSVPVNDGRTIALVLFGGMMAGVRGGGAMVALQEMGLAHVFDEIHTLSCGFSNASYLLAEDAYRGTSIYYQELAGKRFINLLRLWKIVDIDYLMQVFREGKVLDVGRILAHHTRVYVGVHNKDSRKVEYIETHSIRPLEYFDLLEAAHSIPYLHPGSVTIAGHHYMDAGFHDHTITDHVRRVIDSSATDILVVYNLPHQKLLQVAASERVCEVLPHSSRLSRQETYSSVLRLEAQRMGDLMKTVLGSSEPIHLL